MNVIGHMVCAEHLGPGAALGAMLPDLLSLYDRRIRPHKLVRDAPPDGRSLPGDTNAVAVGMRFHFFVDSAFHRAPLFRDSVDVIRGGLAAASTLPGLKRFAAAHVLAELFLDHLLVVEAPGRLGDFYSALDRGRADGLRRYLSELDGLDWEGFASFLGRLGEIRFADGYLDRAHLLDRTERILGRLRQRGFVPAERQAVLEGLEVHAYRIRRELDEFIGAMRRWTPPGGEPSPVMDSRGRAGIE